jgi:hypothetical protein
MTRTSLPDFGRSAKLAIDGAVRIELQYQRGTTMASRSASPERLNLKAGEWVEVRSREEILASLDEQGRLENLPFMPEMLRHCGQRLRVFKRADKTCDPAHVPWSIRRLTNSVHLEGMRCDGGQHGGCQASCLIFWKEAWLKRAPENGAQSVTAGSGALESGDPGASTEASILTASKRVNAEGETLYSCQATELRSYTSKMRSFDPRQYVRDLRSGNLSSSLAGNLRAHRVLEFLLGIIQIFRAVIIGLFNRLQETRHGLPYPLVSGSATKTPVERLNLQPGELVQVRSKEEIMATLGKDQRHRGLWFDSEMLPYCGGIYRVLRRVQQIIDENSGKMIQMKHPCIVLEGVVCKSDFHRLCPRAIYAYWRENWLTRASCVGPQTLAQGSSFENTAREPTPGTRPISVDASVPSAPVPAATK